MFIPTLKLRHRRKVGVDQGTKQEGPVLSHSAGQPVPQRARRKQKKTPASRRASGKPGRVRGARHSFFEASSKMSPRFVRSEPLVLLVNCS